MPGESRVFTMARNVYKVRTGDGGGEVQILTNILGVHGPGPDRGGGPGPSQDHAQGDGRLARAGGGQVSSHWSAGRNTRL